MVMSRGLAICIILLAAVMASADTIITTGSQSWNGTVTISDSRLQLEAYFPDRKPHILTFGGDSLRSVEFNPITFNPGAPPNLPPVSGRLSGRVYLKNGSQENCADDIGIKKEGAIRLVTCERGTKTWKSEEVKRIIFDRKSASLSDYRAKRIVWSVGTQSYRY